MAQCKFTFYDRPRDDAMNGTVVYHFLKTPCVKKNRSCKLHIPISTAQNTITN